MKKLAPAIGAVVGVVVVVAFVKVVFVPVDEVLSETKKESNLVYLIDDPHSPDKELLASPKDWEGGIIQYSNVKRFLYGYFILLAVE